MCCISRKIRTINNELKSMRSMRDGPQVPERLRTASYDGCDSNSSNRLPNTTTQLHPSNSNISLKHNTTDDEQENTCTPEPIKDEHMKKISHNSQISGWKLGEYKDTPDKSNSNLNNKHQSIFSDFITPKSNNNIAIQRQSSFPYSNNQISPSPIMTVPINIPITSINRQLSNNSSYTSYSNGNPNMILPQQQALFDTQNQLTQLQNKLQFFTQNSFTLNNQQSTINNNDANNNENEDSDDNLDIVYTNPNKLQVDNDNNNRRPSELTVDSDGIDVRSIYSNKL